MGAFNGTASNREIYPTQPTQAKQEEFRTLLAQKVPWLRDKLTKDHDVPTSQLEKEVQELLFKTRVVEVPMDFAKGALNPKVTDLVSGGGGNCAAIEGNIYAKFAMDGISITCRDAVKEALRVIVIIVQISAPTLMFWDTFNSGKWRSSSLALTSPCHVLSMCMLFALGAYSTQVIDAELSTIEKLKELLPQLCPNHGIHPRLVGSWTEPTEEREIIVHIFMHLSPASLRCPMMFIVGAVVNTSMLCIGLLATLLIYLSADGAGKIVMSVLSFSFLYKLDDAAGAFGSVILTGNDWPASALGEMWVRNCDSATALAGFIMASTKCPSHVNANLMAFSLADVRREFFAASSAGKDMSCLGCACSLLFVATYCVRGLALLMPIAYTFGVWWQHTSQVTK